MQPVGDFKILEQFKFQVSGNRSRPLRERAGQPDYTERGQLKASLLKSLPFQSRDDRSRAKGKPAKAAAVSKSRHAAAVPVRRSGRSEAQKAVRYVDDASSDDDDDEDDEDDEDEDDKVSVRRGVVDIPGMLRIFFHGDSVCVCVRVCVC